MCGRYNLHFSASQVRARLQNDDMQVDECADDEETRQTYNFAPSYHGLVYREHGDKFQLQAMKWGLIPFWTKRDPGYGSMKTINCRDDSLSEDRGLWKTMKQDKRCVVVAEGFYEWLKKGKEKIPHYVKRADGRLMCFAGLYDCVQFEGSSEKLYTYTIITTSSNQQLGFLHDRMPVILENGSKELMTWLDPDTKWSKELQNLLTPYNGKLDCYPVVKDVGKVGNNSETFIVPVGSKENKSNIGNWFRTGEEVKVADEEKPQTKRTNGIKEEDSEHTHSAPPGDEQMNSDETPDKAITAGQEAQRGIKREHTEDVLDEAPKRKLRSSTSNQHASPKKTTSGNKKITSFFKK